MTVQMTLATALGERCWCSQPIEADVHRTDHAYSVEPYAYRCGAQGEPDWTEEGYEPALCGATAIAVVIGEDSGRCEEHVPAWPAGGNA
jgi:hypothetical protein